jgi:hypothetical protein
MWRKKGEPVQEPPEEEEKVVEQEFALLERVQVLEEKLEHLKRIVASATGIDVS